MAEAALSMEPAVKPRTVKISSKRQITIPAEMYERSGFTDYAYVEWHEDGSLTISPIGVVDEELSIRALRNLIELGLEGEQLVESYKHIMFEKIDYKAAIEEGLRDIEEGRVEPFENLQKEMEAKYGL